MTSRRGFLRSLAAASGLLLMDLARPAGLGHPVWAAVGRAEAGRFSGDMFFAQMHRELMGRRRTRTSSPGEEIDIAIVGGGIAGLDTAWYLLNHPVVKKSGARVRLFEMDDEVGGMAKEFAWEGIPYTNSAAYFYLAEKDHPDMHLYRALGVLDEMSAPGPSEKESLCIGDRVHPDFFERGRGAGHERETKAIRAVAGYMKELLEEACPTVPYKAGEGYTMEEHRRIDGLSLGAFLDQRGQVTCQGKTRRLPEVPAIFREFVENYCYSSFGFSAHETSAWQGLNWFTSEFGEHGVGVLPGGNGRLTTRLVERIAQLDAACLRPSMPVVDVSHDAKRRTNLLTVALRKDGATSSYQAFSARYVVVCCPLFVAGRILRQEMPAPVLEEMDRFRYSAYVVANALIRGTVMPDYWDVYCLDGLAPGDVARESLYRAKPYMDVINATWPLRKRGQAPRDRTVLTVYAPHPFTGQRRELLSDEYCESLKQRIGTDLVRRFASQGLERGMLRDVRVARWGHAMFQARPGLLSGGILDRIQAAVESRGILLAGCDMAGAPTIENCHLTARAAVARVTQMMASGQSRSAAVEVPTAAPLAPGPALWS